MEDGKVNKLYQTAPMNNRYHRIHGEVPTHDPIWRLVDCDDNGKEFTDMVYEKAVGEPIAKVTLYCLPDLSDLLLQLARLHHGAQHVYSLLAGIGGFPMTKKCAWGLAGPYAESIVSRVVEPKKTREMWFLARFYTAFEAKKMELANIVVPLEKLEQETVKWCREILRNNSTAIRVLKSALNAVDDSHSTLQELGGNVILMFYGIDEGNEEKTTYMECRRPEFSKFPRRP
ncbi:1,4-dihydroxy-2-naphthoyl-CoA synthase, peroxisomal-like [Camellia sinensis]|uniref:1,4-dihydroxy-2-naphthoyl-CoA synthase, peroxisomal-like n=1 Tax=Camellia sinensis TaxID=4442 RepID=UPI00103606A3|nr:1,4-dihydroxy-2-naphthoyl-CoA synthase, peroxisomal-like [Camellia sinensis]